MDGAAALGGEGGGGGFAFLGRAIGGGEGEGGGGDELSRKRQGERTKGRGRVTRSVRRWWCGGNAPQVVAPFVFLSGDVIRSRRANLKA
jgi:hypothetical protein